MSELNPEQWQTVAREVPASASVGIRVEVTDLATGEKQVTEVPAHEYFVLTTGNCHVSHIQAHRNGTHVLTVKGRVQR